MMYHSHLRLIIPSFEKKQKCRLHPFNFCSSSAYSSYSFFSSSTCSAIHYNNVQVQYTLLILMMLKHGQTLSLAHSHPPHQVKTRMSNFIITHFFPKISHSLSVHFRFVNTSILMKSVLNKHRNNT